MKLCQKHRTLSHFIEIMNSSGHQWASAMNISSLAQFNLFLEKIIQGIPQDHHNFILNFANDIYLMGVPTASLTNQEQRGCMSTRKRQRSL
ncbi:hypothetical protein DPMN_056632 [Dreissena polymorpha]|uniref:Uncharacterized protein n=1 Tax=Dreissena polymorpha TaxID=45954 RepID=A0A9D4CUR3_DREPO|nr:hypothetical protein DPMN_056632 [Dreissena polymorpha]